MAPMQATLTLAMLIRYRNGDLFEAVILSLQGGLMRVALKGQDDIAEFRLHEGFWFSEDCEPVTFDFTMAILAAVGIVPPEEVDNPAAEASVPCADPLTIATPAGYLN